MGITIGGPLLFRGGAKALENANIEHNKRLARIAVGQRITRAADDAVGVAIAEQLNVQLRSFGAAVRSASDAVSVAQVADAGAQAVSEDLARIRELSVQAGSDLLGANDRAAIQAEIDQRTANISQVVSTTEFNGAKLLDGSLSSKSFQVGPDAADAVSLSIASLDTSALGVEGIDVSSGSSARAALDAADGAIEATGEARGAIGAFQSGVEARISSLRSASAATAGARARIADADIAQEVAALTRSQILEQGALAAHAHAGASERLVASLLGGGD